jgi:predicted nucleic acid-binding protein
LHERRNRIAPDDSNQFLLSLDRLSVEMDSFDEGAQAIDVSRRCKLSVYGASYLALVMRERLSLAALDKDLAASLLSPAA